MEHWEELAPGGLRLLWDDALFPPGTDSFLLSALPRPRPGLRVCDLGCGTGLVGFLLLQRQRDLSLTGVDREERAMTLARRCAAENGLADRAVFETRILDILGEESDEAQIQAQRDAEYRRKVLDAFLEYGKLKSIPAQRKKERILLEEIVKVFDYDRIYSEREVNLRIADFYDDFCTLRRDMIGEKLMDRDTRGYWRVKPAP